MSSPTLPDHVKIAKNLSTLLGREVTAAKARGKVTFKGPVVVATYVDDQDKPCVSCVCDFGAAGHMGGALSLIPIGVVEQAVKKADFDSELLAASREVLNVLAGLINTDLQKHLRLTDAVVHKSAPKESMAGATRRELTIGVHGYGGGEFVMVLH